MKITKEKITFLSEGQKIQGTLIKPTEIKGKIAAVIFFHGMTSSEKNYIPIAEKLAEQGVCGLTVSVRGHGESEGDFSKLTFKDAVQDGLNTYDFLTKYNFVDVDKIGICGASLGSAIASMVSSQRKVQSMAFRVPATYSEKMLSMTYEEIMAEEPTIFNEIANVSENPTINAIEEFKGNLLVIISEKDTSIPIEIPRQYLLSSKNASKKEEFIIKDATHVLTEKKWREDFINKVINWFIITLDVSSKVR